MSSATTPRPNSPARLNDTIRTCDGRAVEVAGDERVLTKHTSSSGTGRSRESPGPADAAKDEAGSSVLKPGDTHGAIVRRLTMVD